MGSRFRALAWGTREDMLVKYEPNPKHKPIPTPGRRGSICPSGVDGPRLLCDSVQAGQKRYATDGQHAYCAQCHDGERHLWHGYPVSWAEVPPSIVSGWISKGLVDRRTVKRIARRAR
jgi:hypothetical protein